MENLVLFSLNFTKVSQNKSEGKLLWSAVASDTDKDSYSDRMSLDLFKAFVEKIENNIKVPEVFRSEFWNGGMPYLSIAHYSDQNGKGIPGNISAVYVDGKQLKAKGEFLDNELGWACYRSIYNSLYKEKSDLEPVRISIGFLDWKHKHEDTGFIFTRKSLDDNCPECKTSKTNKTYLDGQLIHLALIPTPR